MVVTYPQTDGLAERIIQTIKYFLMRFCEYCMKYKDHEGYTHDWVMILPAVQLAYNTSQHSTTRRSPSLLIGKSSVEEKLTEESSPNHPVFPVSLVKPYFQKEEYKFPSRKKNATPPKIVEVEESPGPVKTTIRARKIRLNGKDHSQYLVRFQNQTADKYKWLAEDAITDGNLYLRRFMASRRTEQSYQ
ncbi:hypothetical protein O181_118170 [Austropuccinia psidii MF-1]|uniref:Integrase catalytic domain-containing protein n=1 Tax=Austropuccinia psidii MF-1 TaxID=1389203 RepID=A0A9Q3KFU9_9BASI|nr:hypothetical protein [Austropuccinia psidii MF-1]